MHFWWNEFQKIVKFKIVLILTEWPLFIKAEFTKDGLHDCDTLDGKNKGLIEDGKRQRM